MSHARKTNLKYLLIGLVKGVRTTIVRLETEHNEAVSAVETDLLCSQVNNDYCLWSSGKRFLLCIFMLIAQISFIIFLNSRTLYNSVVLF